jgi:hypothetical protein
VSGSPQTSERLSRKSPAAPYLLGFLIAIVIGAMKYWWGPGFRHNVFYAMGVGLVFGVLVTATAVQVRKRSDAS